MLCPTLQRLRELERDAWYGKFKDVDGVPRWGDISVAMGKLVHTPEGHDYAPGFLLDLEEEKQYG